MLRLREAYAGTIPRTLSPWEGLRVTPGDSRTPFQRRPAQGKGSSEENRRRTFSVIRDTLLL